MVKADKWKMNRAGLLNFWYYDDEVFDFSEGKLLLRGSNGSGKSVTMQSLLPVLLDGRKSPDRLDPFGSKARRMEDYLLGEKEIVDRDERTGYLFIEYELAATGQYVTTGIGLQAKRHKPMKFWGFVITDNRRIGHDFELYKMEKGEKIPYSRIELENRIAGGGEVVQTAKEYMALVNKYVFGFGTMEAYEDLIKLLIQLRSPKLSKDFRPTVIYDILEEALPPLTDDDLRHLSDTIEHMDQTRQHIEQLERELTALGKLNQAYGEYNEYQLAMRAKGWKEAGSRLEKNRLDTERGLKEHEELLAEIEKYEAEKRHLIQKEDSLNEQKERLASHDVFRLEKDLAAARDQLAELREDLGKRGRKVDQFRRQARHLAEEKDRAETVIYETERDINDHLLDLASSADEASFGDHEGHEDVYRRTKDERFTFDYWEKQARDHKNKLDSLVRELKTLEGMHERFKEKEKQIADEEFQLDRLKAEHGDLERLFEEDKQKMAEQIHRWAAQNDFLPVSDEVLQEAARQLSVLYELADFRDITGLFAEVEKEYRNSVEAEVLQEEHRGRLIAEEMEKKQEELGEWKNRKDPEPPRPEQTVSARAALADRGIAALPLYEAVEFKPDTSPEFCSRIEAALGDSGLLDALITDAPHEDFPYDKVIVPEPVLLSHTLADYLTPALPDNTSLTPGLVEEVLQSICIGEGENHLTEAGAYRIGLISGHAPDSGDAKYIGRTARSRYREKMIQELENEIAALGSRKSSVDESIEALNRQAAASKTAVEEFPTDDDLFEAYKSIRALEIRMKEKQQTLESLDGERKKLYREHRLMNQKIEEAVRPFNISRSSTAFQEADDMMAHYLFDLKDLKMAEQQRRNQAVRLEELGTRLTELEAEMDETAGERRELEDKISRRLMGIESIEKELEQEGAEDLRRQVKQVNDEYQSVRNRLQTINGSLPAKKNALEMNKSRLNDLEKNRFYQAGIEQSWAESFSEELNRGFVAVGDDYQDSSEAADHILRKCGGLLEQKDASRVADLVTRRFYDLGGDLMEYQMSLYPEVPETPEWAGGKLPETVALYFDDWRTKAKRTLIRLNYFGKQVTPLYVEKELEMSRERQQQMLDEEDRALYEEILFKSVGSKLRSRIKRAERWTKKMNTLMESRRSSSGLTFSIRWKPKTADSEQEMDTQDLVSLLNRPAQVLKEEDMDRMITHFRSRINQAKELVDTAGEGGTLLQVLKEVLDYRKWFSFILSYKKPSENKRELTNNAFYRFSGGEKAMAMYIPLFAACYSRYQEASDHAPFIISLDEAFAGVDENNIREMFEIVEELGFDYIMNSQVLWGDYDTAGHLAISELLRPQNADFVTVMNYKWDGEKIRAAIDEDPILMTED